MCQFLNCNVVSFPACHLTSMTSLGFPGTEAIAQGMVPQGYPLVCPRCGTVIENVFWDQEANEFLSDGDVVLCFTLCDHFFIAVVREGEHSHCSVFQLLHEC
jgi:hypothetical protein